MIGSYMRKAFSSPYFRNIRPYSFSTSQINYSEYRNVYRKLLQTEEYLYSIDNGDKMVELTIGQDATIQELKEQFKQLSKDIKEVKVTSLDLAEYADVTRLSDLATENHYLIVNNKSLYKVTSIDKSLADQDEALYQKNQDLCEKLGLPFIERKILLNYLKRVDILNQERFGKKLFTGQEIANTAVDKDIFIQNLIEAIINNKNQQIEKEEALIQMYHEQKEKLENLKLQRAELEKKV